MIPLCAHHRRPLLLILDNGRATASFHLTNLPPQQQPLAARGPDSTRQTHATRPSPASAPWSRGSRLSALGSEPEPEPETDFDTHTHAHKFNGA